MNRQTAVVGLGRFGISVATTLCDIGHEVMALDRSEAKVQNIAPKVTHAVQADATNEIVLRQLGIDSFHAAIVAIGTDIKSSVLCTILLKKMGIEYVVARANDELHGSILNKIGADLVIYPEHEMGTRMAHALTLVDVSDFMTVAEHYFVAKLTAPPYFVGARLSELELGREGKWEVPVLLIQRGREIIVSPRRGEKVQEEDVLVVAGSHDKLERLLADARKKRNEE